VALGTSTTEHREARDAASELGQCLGVEASRRELVRPSAWHDEVHVGPTLRRGGIDALIRGERAGVTHDDDPVERRCHLGIVAARSGCASDP
jgi:hypothetical protein